MTAFLLFLVPFFFPLLSFAIDSELTNGVDTNTVVYNYSIQIENQLDYDIAPMSLEVGVARGLAGGLLSPIAELGDADFVSNEFSNIEAALSGFFDFSLTGNTYTNNTPFIEFHRPMTRELYLPNKVLASTNFQSLWSVSQQPSWSGSPPSLPVYNGVVSNSFGGGGKSLQQIFNQYASRFQTNNPDAYFFVPLSTPPLVAFTNLPFPGRSETWGLTLIDTHTQSIWTDLGHTLHTVTSVVVVIQLILCCVSCFLSLRLGGNPSTIFKMYISTIPELGRSVSLLAGGWGSDDDEDE